MANQSPDRRTVLEMLAKVAVVSQFPGFSRWSFAGDHDHQSAPVRTVSHYQPQFFSETEYRLLDQLCELIIPRDDTPGARDAGVPEFIDHMIAHEDREPQFQFRRGLELVNAVANTTRGRDFMALSEPQQEDVLQILSKAQPSEIESPAFFKLLRSYTVMGYYTSRTGLEAIDFPGLRAYSASPECPHKNDPEHLHLPPARY